MCRRWMVLAIAVSVCVVAHLLQSNWPLRARFNLLLEGHGLARLEEPRFDDPSSPRTRSLASRLVYKNKIYIGYLDGQAEFRSASETEPHLIGGRYMATAVILFYSKWISLLIAVWVGASFLWRFCKNRLSQQPT